ncbi:uncharacterized protein LOC120886266 [Ictidomys tridecemlineatus]
MSAFLFKQTETADADCACGARTFGRGTSRPRARARAHAGASQGGAGPGLAGLGGAGGGVRLGLQRAGGRGPLAAGRSRPLPRPGRPWGATEGYGAAEEVRAEDLWLLLFADLAAAPARLPVCCSGSVELRLERKGAGYPSYPYHGDKVLWRG